MTLAGRVLLSQLAGGRGEDLPGGELVETVEVRRDHLAAYDAVCGFHLRDEAPPTYPHVLAFPLAVRLMTDRAFPLRPLGLVHVRERIVQRRPLRAGEPVTMRVRAEGLELTERGTRFDVVGRIDTAWEARSTYLRRAAGRRRASAPAEPPPEPAAVWPVPADTGRRYAAVSGDRNPIHLHPLTSRPFGQPRPIAHGLWLLARCLAALEGELPEACAIDATFRRPVRLPARVAFSSRPDGEARAFALHDAHSGERHLTATARPAASADPGRAPAG